MRKSTLKKKLKGERDKSAGLLKENEGLKKRLVEAEAGLVRIAKLNAPAHPFVMNPIPLKKQIEELKKETAQKKTARKKAVKKRVIKKKSAKKVAK